MIDADLSCSVSQVNAYIKQLLENDESLHYLMVKGEISNFKQAMNGHFYFSLKDEKSSISCVLFKDYAASLKFAPKDGDKVKVVASISCFPQRGTYSLRVYSIDEIGKGELLLELEELKKKLQLEGLFDESKKKPINLFPNAIGLITAKGSAALKDMIINIQRRFPPCKIYVFPCKVQGEGASNDILEKLKLAETYPLDTIIIGRGGGSSEDLSAFNDEALVREAYKCNIPIISAVGHEIDMTLIDFVSDKRASTPTGAAELATIDQREIQEKMSLSLEIMRKAVKDKYNDLIENIIDIKEELLTSYQDYISSKKDDVHLLDEKLTVLDPYQVLNRGYSITTDKNGKSIKTINDIKSGDMITTYLKDGSLTSQVDSTRGK